MIRCSVASARPAEFRREPSFAEHRIRSERFSSSGSSLEVTITPSPLATQTVDEPVQLGLGPDVDATSRIIEQQNSRASQQPAAENAQFAGCRH